jgi:hypothetical protein
MDCADAGGHVEPDKRKSGLWRFRRVDAPQGAVNQPVAAAVQAVLREETDKE